MIRRIDGLTALIVLLFGLSITIMSYAQKEEPEKDKEISKIKEAVLTAIGKQKETKGYHFEDKMTGMWNMSKTNIRVTGIHQNPDIEYSKSASSEQYTKGKKQVAKRPDGKWDRLPDITTELMLEKIQISQGAILENVKSGRKEKIKDKNCKTIESSISTEALKGWSASIKDDPAWPSGTEVKFSKSCFKLWIGSEDQLPYKYFFSFTVEPVYPPKAKESEKSKRKSSSPDSSFTPWTFTTEITFFDYDKDVEVKIPKKGMELMDKENKE